MLYRVLAAIVGFLFRIFYRIEVENEYELPEGPILICPNHIHIFDPIVIAIILDRPIHFMAKKELFDRPILGKLLKSLYVFPIDRENPSMSSIKNAINILKDGKIVGIFMEGTRVKEFSLDNAKAGVSMIAVRSKATIVPVKIEANYRVFSKIKIIFRDPVSYTEFDKKEDSYESFAKDLLVKIYGKEINENQTS